MSDLPPQPTSHETAFQSRTLTESAHHVEEVDEQGVPTSVGDDHGAPEIALPTDLTHSAVANVEGEDVDEVEHGHAHSQHHGHMDDEDDLLDVKGALAEDGTEGVITPAGPRSSTGAATSTTSLTPSINDRLIPTAPTSSIPGEAITADSVTTHSHSQSLSESEYDPEIADADIAIIPPPQTSNIAAGSTTSLSGSTTSSAAERMHKVLGPPVVPERRSSYASLAVSEGGGDYYTPMGIDDGEREEILVDRSSGNGERELVDGEEQDGVAGEDVHSKPFGFIGLGPADGLAPPLLTNPSAYGLPSGTPGIPVVQLETIADGDETTDAPQSTDAPISSPNNNTNTNTLLTPTSPPPTFSKLNTTTSRARSNSNRSQGEGGERGANLKAWWKGFKTRTGSLSGGSSGGIEGGQRALAALAEPNKGKGKDTPEGHSVFAIPLEKSLEIASVQISTSGPKGELYVWGYIPVVVAKCGSHLKATATEVEGTFRVSGSAKRMKELQAIFDGPPKYGKDLEWKNTTFTTHDVATILRRYLTQMPEPIIPYDLYYHFRDMLSNPEVDAEQAIRVFKGLISRMPKPNQYLLIYVLDLLSVFARKSDKNLMTATNLAMIFQPGIISHSKHDMAPAEHGLSQKVLIFLIEHQDSFMLGMDLERVHSRGSDPSGESSHGPSQESQSVSPAPQSLSPAPPSLSPAPVVTLPLSPPVSASSASSPVENAAAGTVPASVGSTAPLKAKAPTTHAVVISAPRPPPRERPAPGEMLPSDSDSDEPEGGYYVKSGDPTSLLRSKTLTARRPRTPGLPPATGLGIALATSPRKRVTPPPPKIIIVDNPQEPMTGYGLAHPTPYKRPVEKKEPVLEIHDNPPFQAGGLSRRRTAPTKRGDKPVRTPKERKEKLPARPGKASAPVNAEAP